MKNITLFHSYNYVNEKFIQKKHNIYDLNYNLIFSLMNIPYYKNLYFLKIERILQKKKYSKKKNNSFYTKHNLKIYVQINYKLLKYYVDNKINIPEIDILYKLVMTNISIVDINEYVHNVVCINKSFNKKITNTINYISNNYCFYQMNELKFDIIKKKIVKKNENNYMYSINGVIIFYDIFIKLLYEFSKLNLKNTLIICNKYQKPNVECICNNYSTYNGTSNNYWDTIIVLDESINIDKLNYKKQIICINKTTNIKINDLLELYYKYFNINLYHLVNSKLIYNLLNTIIFRNYSYKITKINTIKINPCIPLNIKVTLMDNYIPDICNICFSKYTNIKTKCHHYFCTECVRSIIKKNIFKCPYCRCNTNIDDMTYLIKSKEDIFNEDIKIDPLFKYLIKKSWKKKIIVLSKCYKKIKYLKFLFVIMDLKYEIYNIKNRIPQKNNIYFLENKNEYDMNYITNCLFNETYKKLSFNFFSLSK
jgi:hypothetical protein